MGTGGGPMTKRFDKICIAFVQKIPTSFKTTFTPGMLMPDTYLLTKDIIADFVNAALLKLFNQFWQASAGDYQKFMGLFPELVRLSDPVSAVSGSQGWSYPIDNPYLDFEKAIGGLGPSNKFIKLWDESKFTIAMSGIYPEYTPTDSNPAIIGIHKEMFIFPQKAYTFKLQYIALPLDPTTGDSLIQNGDYDSPFTDQWNAQIADMAYDLYLEETQETT